MKGSYVLLIYLNQTTNISVGKLGILPFKKGYYVYVGSALNGLKQRIQRHLQPTKKIHWHIDYLLQEAKIINCFYKENNAREECIFAQMFEKKTIPISGFGCSDCHCRSHLFYGTMQQLEETIKTLNMKAYK